MKNCITPIIVVLLLTAIGGQLFGGSPSPNKSTPDLNDARRTGWQMALLVIGRLDADDQKNFPGIQAWLKDFHKVARGIDLKVAPDQWPVIEIGELLTRNPNFWQAYYEIAPGDPGLMLLHAGLLLCAGEATRASHLLVVAGQRPGIPKELRQAFEIGLAQSQKVGERPNALILEGIMLHDKAEYAQALKKYQEALTLWPQNGFAHYEMGLTLRHQQLIAAGEKLPPQDSVIVNSGKRLSPDVVAAFAKARQHDPFQFKAYQGDDKDVIRGALALARKGIPAWQQVVRNRQKQVDDEILESVRKMNYP